MALELRDWVVGSGPAQQAMLSEGSNPANTPNQIFELNLQKKKHWGLGTSQRYKVRPLLVYRR